MDETTTAGTPEVDQEGAPDDRRALEARLEELQSELGAARALADERLSELAYARAEIDNVRKRAIRSAEEGVTSSRKALFAKFLGVLDNLERALAFDDSEGLRGGLAATKRGFEALLANEGVVAIESSVGRPFDPHIAEAIATRDSDDHEDDTVVEEAQRGYRLHDELLRPAMVVVAKRKSE